MMRIASIASLALAASGLVFQAPAATGGRGGAWQSLDGTHTVRGDAETLEVHQAIPQLVQ